MVRLNEPTTKKTGADRLSLLYRISQTINSSLDLDRVMEVLMDEVISATNAERGFLMVLGENERLQFRTARGMDQKTLETSEFRISRSITERVARDGISLLTSNAQVDKRFDNRASVRLYGLRSVVSVPIKLKDKILGVIYIDNHFQNGIFSQEDLNLLNSIAASAGIAIENARLYKLATERGRMQKELQMAQDVQVSLIPKSTPQIQGWEFAACWKPAHEVSGDFYDFIPLPSGKFGLVVADVSGKGMPAALFMALSRSIIRSVVGQNGMPSEDIIKVNRLIQRDAAQGMFITLFYAEIDPKTNTLTYINAGHNPPMLLGKTNGTVHYLERTGMAAGVEEDSRYEQVTLDFLLGDTLLIYTDGVIDIDQDGGAFGVEKLEKSFIGNCGLSVSDLIGNLELNLCNLTNQEDLLDDVTILAARRTS